MTKIQKITICLDDIRDQDVFISTKSKKKYVSLLVQERNGEDKYGNTHSVSISQTKEQRDSKEPKHFVGNGVEFSFGDKE